MTHPFRSPAVAAAIVAVLLGGAIAGFFYAWVCSTMWGLDQADPHVAIAAMRAMNDSVRNAVFFPAFFLTPVAMAVAAVLAWRERATSAAMMLGAAALIYLIGGLGLTAMVNVPMNEALAAAAIPADAAGARQLWSDYSGRWQAFNQIRTLASFLSFGLAAVALVALGRHSHH
jgi:uncharacterized membrane protein